MNRTGRGKVGRYKTINGVLHKKCNGPLHQEEGEWLTLDRYFINKKGKRAGKPISQCKACSRYYKFKDTNRGLVEVSRVWWIFVELRNRLGKAEVCRRLGVSRNFWYRVERGIYVRMYKKTALKAILVLREAREKNEVRHRDSILSGAAQRGRKEKIPTAKQHLYKPHGDSDTELRNRGKTAA